MHRVTLDQVLDVFSGPAGMFVLPRISPKRFRVDKFIRVFDTLYFTSIAASVCVSVLGVLEVLGVHVPAGMSALPISLALIVAVTS